MAYSVKKKVETITSNTILVAEDFGGWQAICVGDDPVTVNGIELSPSGNVVGLDYTNLHPSAIWDDTITIRFAGTGTNPKLIVTRLKYIQR
ncbi:MAG: hypothetical protein RBR97_12190 [Bacteroidales bacterium]|nr:hypothetical protein [Bacteroidales bacterium]